MATRIDNINERRARRQAQQAQAPSPLPPAAPTSAPTEPAASVTPSAGMMPAQPVAAAQVSGRTTPDNAPVPTILLDCVTLWMSNILFALDDPQDAAAFETSLTEEVDELLHTMRAFPCRWVLVSGETGLGGIRAERLARVFDDGLGLANQMLAAQAREAFLVVAGRCLRLEKLEF